MAGFRHRFRDVDLLVIDDIHFLAKAATARRKSSSTPSTRCIRPTSRSCSRRTPRPRKSRTSRTASSAASSGAGRQRRRALLRDAGRHSEEQGADARLELPDDAACYIASRIDSNIRELEGVIIKIQRPELR